MTVRTHLLHGAEPLFRGLGEYDDELEMDRAFLSFLDLTAGIGRFVLGLPRFEVVLSDRKIDVVVCTDPLCGGFRYILCHLFNYYLSFTVRYLILSRIVFPINYYFVFCEPVCKVILANGFTD